MSGEVTVAEDYKSQEVAKPLVSCGYRDPGIVYVGPELDPLDVGRIPEDVSRLGSFTNELNPHVDINRTPLEMLGRARWYETKFISKDRSEAEDIALKLGYDPMIIGFFGTDAVEQIGKEVAAYWNGLASMRLDEHVRMTEAVHLAEMRLNPKYVVIVQDGLDVTTVFYGNSIDERTYHLNSSGDVHEDPLVEGPSGNLSMRIESLMAKIHEKNRERIPVNIF